MRNSSLDFKAIRTRDNDRCHWCNRPVEFGIRAARHAGRYMPIDLTKKPFFTEENFAVACNECWAKMRDTPELNSPTKNSKREVAELTVLRKLSRNPHPVVQLLERQAVRFLKLFSNIRTQ